MQDENHCGIMQFWACDQYLDVCQDTLEYVHFERTEPSWEAKQFSAMVKKFPAFYGTRRFITAFTSASCKWYVTGYVFTVMSC